MKYDFPADMRDDYAANGLIQLLAARDIRIPVQNIQLDHRNRQIIVHAHYPASTLATHSSVLNNKLRGKTNDLHNVLRGMSGNDYMPLQVRYFTIDHDGRPVPADAQKEYHQTSGEMATLTVNDRSFNQLIDALATYGKGFPMPEQPVEPLDQYKAWADALPADFANDDEEPKLLPPGKTAGGDASDKPQPPRPRSRDDDDGPSPSPWAGRFTGGGPSGPRGRFG